MAATENDTVPLPFPLAPLVTVIQLALLVADHGHPASDVTSVEAVPPLAAIDALVDEIENVHPAPACVTVNVCPAIVIVPVRGRGAAVGRRAETDTRGTIAARAAADRQPAWCC